MFWANALANFAGSVAAAALLWFVVTRFYELPRSRKQVRELLSVSYAICKFELVFNKLYCKEVNDESEGHVPAGFPVTQAWEVLHSTGAFRYMPPQVTGKLTMVYSLLFRLRGNVEFIQAVFLKEGGSLDGPNPYTSLRTELSNLTRQVAAKILNAQDAFEQVLQVEIDKLGPSEKRIFNRAYLLYREETGTKTANIAGS